MSYQDDLLSVFVSMVLTIVANALLTLALVFVLLASGISFYSPIAPIVATSMSLAVTQILCLHTLRRQLIRKGKAGVAKGFVMGAVITALINGSCFVAMAEPLLRRMATPNQ